MYKRFFHSIMSDFLFPSGFIWFPDPLPITSNRSAGCKIDCECMILGFLITLYFQYDIYLPLVSLSLTFILKNTAYFLLLAAFSLIIFLSDFLSYPYLKYEFNDSHFSSIHSLLAKCIYIFFHKLQAWQKFYMDT